MEQKKNKGLLNFLKDKLAALQDWMKPDPADHPLLQVVKLLFKSLAVLILIAFSPAIIVILILAFFAAF